MQRRRVLIAIATVVVLGGWYAFRPERLFIDRTVNEPLLAATAGDRDAELGGQGLASAPTFPTLRRGRFRSGAHETTGRATVHDLGGGKHVLRLTEFSTSNGPDVHVYLVAAADITADDDVKHADVVDLGVIKGNRGDQNYELPADVDLSKYESVSIWCKRFSVNFGSAALTTP
jgi:hypothetical protein